MWPRSGPARRSTPDRRRSAGTRRADGPARRARCRALRVRGRGARIVLEDVTTRRASPPRGHRSPPSNARTAHTRHSTNSHDSNPGPASSSIPSSNSPRTKPTSACPALRISTSTAIPAGGPNRSGSPRAAHQPRRARGAAQQASNAEPPADPPHPRTATTTDAPELPPAQPTPRTRAPPTTFDPAARPTNQSRSSCGRPRRRTTNRPLTPQVSWSATGAGLDRSQRSPRQRSGSWGLLPAVSLGSRRRGGGGRGNSRWKQTWLALTPEVNARRKSALVSQRGSSRNLSSVFLKLAVRIRAFHRLIVSM